ncbi:MAG: hypothetical protein ABI891_01890 [Acidobacteriota bacterium]
MQLEKINKGSSDNNETLYLMGGAALMIVGAGLLLSNSSVRNTVSAGLASVLPDLQEKFGLNFADVGTDLKRYMKMRSM